MLNKSKIVKDAQKFVTKGQIDKAIAEYAKITAAYPNDTNTHNTIGDLWLKVGDKEKAIVSFRTAADVLNKDGFTLKAIALYKKVLNINPDQVDVQMQMGKLNAERGMLGNANENYLAAASYFTRQGKRDKALEIYKILCNLNPKNITLAQKLAELYMAEGMEKEGIGKLIELAEIKAQDGELKDARSFLDRAAKKGADRHDFIKVKALVDIKDGRLPEAVSTLEELRKLDPGDAKVLGLLSEAYLRSGQYEKAADSVSSLVDAEPANWENRKKLIDIYVKSGDFESAWTHYRHQIDHHIDRKEYNKAQKLIQEYLEVNKDSIEARQVLADLYTKIGREDRITELYSEMAAIYARNGEKEKAFNIYNKLLEKDPENQDIKAALSGLDQTGETAQPAAVESAAPDEAPVAEETETSAEAEGLYGAGIEQLSIEERAEEESLSIEGAWLPGEEPLSLEGAGEVEEETGGAPAYELPETHEELPPLDFGEGAGGEIFSEGQAQDNTYEITDEDTGGIAGLDIFGATEEEVPAPSVDDEIKVVSHTPTIDLSEFEETAGEQKTGPAETIEEPAYQEASSFDEGLTEADVYIKYGLYPKAIEVLIALEATRPANPELLSRFIEVSRSQGDDEVFISRTLQLAGVYKGKGKAEEARAVIADALEMHPKDERLKRFIGSQAGESMPEEISAPDREEVSFGSAEAEDAVGITELYEQPHAGPGSVDYIEELAEAEFYAGQGLIEEAKTIYRKLLAASPENDEIRSRYNVLLDLEQESAPEPAEKEAVAPPSFDNELDMAFREMDFGEEPGEPAGVPAPEPGEEPEAGPGEEVEAPTAGIGGGADFSGLADETSFEGVSEEPSYEAAEETSFAGSTKERTPLEPLDEEEETVVEDEDFFDLAAELREEMGADIITPVPHAGHLADNNLDEVFQEFKRGVNEQLGSEDYETHYNLGIAYKEMGMIDEALNEFTEASKDSSRSLDCASMLGLCHLEKGEYGKAIEHFKKGLGVKGREKEEYFGLRYDMATAYELSGDPASAHSELTEISRTDANFRDVNKRLKTLEKSVESAAGGDEQTDQKAKKSRVSYL